MFPTLKRKLKRLKIAIQVATRKSDYTELSKLQYGQLPELEKLLAEAENKTEKNRS